MNKEKDSFIWIKNASTQCFVALFPESTKTMLSWQVFWLIPLWMPSHPPGGQWLVEYSKILEGFTAAGLFRICTWFPFSSLISNRTGRGETKTGTKITKTIRFANTPDNFCYICCNLKYLIWLSTLCRKLAWERATDKKIPSCLESLYSSCFQITLFSWCKGSIFSWLPVIFGHKISRSFQETYTADMTAIP